VITSLYRVTQTSGDPPQEAVHPVQSHASHPIIHHSGAIDIDQDGIQDSLETRILQNAPNVNAVTPVVVTLNDPVADVHLDSFVKSGGRISHIYHNVTYGFAGVIPSPSIEKFASLVRDDLVLIEYDAPLRYHLDVSVPMIRVRPTIWDTYGYKGASDLSIAILDTGIDDSHPDVGPFGDSNFSRKIVGWYDATPENSQSPEDYGEHGTHVAAIAAGTGMANRMQDYGNIETTFTYMLPQWGYGYIDYVDVMNPGVIELNCSWDGNNNVLLRLYDPAEEWVIETSGRSQPLILTYNTTGTPHQTGRYGVLVGNLAGPSGDAFSCTEAYPYQGLNDSHNLLTGVAPNSKLVGVKVFDNTGSGTLSYLIEALDWVILNRKSLNIVVASLSLSLEDGAIDTTLDQKVDTMVQNGIVTTISAGNDYPDYSIGSPGTAAFAITVAATNDQNGITAYSSNGDPVKNEFGLIKPDVAAPGGTFNSLVGNKIISADSNDVDAGYSDFMDRNDNDYQQMAGTSMSTPHVAGLAALLVQASGEWNWTLDEVLKVKMIMSMTSFEVQSGEGTNVPPLDRGGKDEKEGFGRIAPDAAIQAATLNYSIGQLTDSTFGSGLSDKKVWARQVQLQGETTYNFNLSVPSGADFDMFLYDASPDEYGQPLILEKSINASLGMDENLCITPEEPGTFYLVVKWVSGSGTFTIESSIKTRNLAVLDVVPSVREAFEGWMVNISVTVKNLGELTETFNTTAYFDSNVIAVLLATSLAPNDSLTLIFEWNTTDVTPGNYTISATAGPLQEETDLTDNTFTDGTVRLKILGDANDDGVIDIFDALQTLAAFGVYDPNCDFNGDGKIDLIDALILMDAFRKQIYSPSFGCTQSVF